MQVWRPLQYGIAQTVTAQGDERCRTQATNVNIHAGFSVISWPLQHLRGPRMNLDKASAGNTDAPRAPPEWTMEMQREGVRFTVEIQQAFGIWVRS